MDFNGTITKLILGWFLDGDSNYLIFIKVGGAKQLSINYGAYNSGVLKTDIAIQSLINLI